MKPVGYILNTANGLEGETGLFYDYILAGNGLFIRARNNHIGAQICIAPVEVRGLAPLEERVDLLHGIIPRRLLDMALSLCEVAAPQEQYVAITWENNEFRIKAPSQERTGAKIKYSTLENVVLDIHSHGRMRAFFSGEDDKDDQGLGLHAVIGHVESEPEALLRVSVYGYFAPVDQATVFE